jgi:hypothetical protein
VIVIAIVAIVTTATIGIVASLSKRAEPGINRDLAMMTAQNAMERARTASAYLLSAQNATDSASVASDASTQDKSYILNASSTFSVSAPLPASTCGVNGGAPASILLNVSTTLTVNVTTLEMDVFDVKVTYPLNACTQAAGTATVELSEVLPTGAYIPGTLVYEPLTYEPWEQ